MKFQKNQLMKYRQRPLEIDTPLTIAPEDIAVFETQIIALSTLQVNGKISYLPHDDVELALTVKGEVTVPSSRTLTPVQLPVDLQIDEAYVDDDDALERFDETEAVFVLDSEVLDVDRIILDNIVTSLPSRVVAEDEEELADQNGWAFMSEDAAPANSPDEETKTKDPRLAALDQLLTDNSEEQ